ncbi:MAG TPA: CHASE2 domain-containing protein, partial [Acidobacteriota bacterium]
KILALALSITGIFLTLSFYFVSRNTLQEWDYRIVDLFFRIRGPIPPSDKVAIVALDRESSRQLQRKTMGWKRSDFAEAIRALTDAGADLIAIDYVFAIADQDPTEDAALRGAIAEAANVILASDISSRNRALPFAPFREQEVGEGFINFLPDPDGVVRQIPPLYATTTPEGQVQLDFPFSVQIALAHLYPEGDFQVNLSRSGEVTLGDLRIPYWEKSASAGFVINFTGPPEHFPILPFYKVLRREFRKEQIAAKIILIGSMNPYFHDYYTTAYRMPAARAETVTVEKKAMQSMFGVEIHANAIDTLIRRRFLAPIGLRTLVFALIFTGGLAVFLSIMARWNAFLIAGVSLLILGLLFFGSYMLFVQGWIVRGAPFYFCVIGVVLTGILARQAEEASERRYITQLFGRYVAANVVEELLRNRDLVQLSGKKQRLTIFFSDIRGFTSMSEKMKPEEVS